MSKETWIVATPTEESYSDLTREDAAGAYETMRDKFKGLFTPGLNAKTGEILVKYNNQKRNSGRTITFRRAFLDGNIEFLDGRKLDGRIHVFSYVLADGYPQGEAVHVNSGKAGILTDNLMSFYDRFSWRAETDVLQNVNPAKTKKPIDQIILPTLTDLLKYAK